MMSNINRSRRREVVLGAVFGLAGCWREAGEIEAPTLQPHERANFGGPFPPRLPNWGDTTITLSPDGRLLAGCFPGRPANEVVVVHVERQSQFVLRHPEERFKLMSPRFSADGSRLILIATPYPYNGTGELITYHFQSGRCTGIRCNPPRAFSSPAFSPDGARLAYFRDVLPYPEVPRIRPEERSWPWKALFELDLQTNIETRLSRHIWPGGGIWYDADGEALYLFTGMPMKAVDHGTFIWYEDEESPPDWTNPRRAAFNGYRWDRRAEIPYMPDLLFPHDAMWDAAGKIRGGLCGVDRPGRALMHAHEDGPGYPEGGGRVALLCTPNAVIRAFREPGARLEEPAISWDGSTVAACLGTRLDNGQLVYASEHPLELVYWREDHERVRFSQADLHPTDIRALSIEYTAELPT